MIPPADHPPGSAPSREADRTLPRPTRPRVARSQRTAARPHVPGPRLRTAALRRRTARVLSLDEQTTAGYLHRSVADLAEQSPHMSCQQTTTRRQRGGLTVLAVVIGLGLLLSYRTTLTILFGLCTYLYFAVVTYRIVLFRRSLSEESLLHVSPERARAQTDLPRYTILVPAYREGAVVPQLLRHLTALEYPPELLDIRILLELDDEQTLAAVQAADPPPHISIVLVPSGGPRTKPKALNYGLCLAQGELLTVFDAEDRPEPLQLLRAVATFRASAPEVVCLQASLSYFNSRQNVITRWFQAEYTGWFRYFLPGLVSRDVPLPLGGTSNHVRTDVLLEVGGWDPFNVTEDADLGIRLHRAGYRTGVLDSVTYEEANSDFVNWAKQRSRWHKGYLQTWLVHMRQPRRLWSELGPSGFVQFNLFVGGTPLLALLNPIFWTLTVLWFLTTSMAIGELFPPVIYYPALLCWVLGNSAITYLSVLSVQTSEQPSLGGAALLTPAYWVMMSIAAYKALWQLVRDPSLWEKTTHGLDVREDDVGADVGSTGGAARPPRVQVAFRA